MACCFNASSQPWDLRLDEVGHLRLDAFRRDLVADVFCGVGNPLPQSIDAGRGSARTLVSFLNGSRHGRHCPIVHCLRTNSPIIESFLGEFGVGGRALVGDGLGKLGAEQEDLCGIIGPEHQND
jgi:hypothetical protein